MSVAATVPEPLMEGAGQTAALPPLAICTCHAGTLGFTFT
jgi:hypothetical protein